MTIINKLLQKITDTPLGWIPILVYLIALTVNLLFVIISGPNMGGDSGRYYVHANTLLSGDSLNTSVMLLYGGYVGVVALAKIIAGESVNYVWLIIIFQATLSASIPVMLYFSGRIIKPDSNPYIMAGLSLFLGVGCYDHLLWTRYILTDSIFITLMVLVIYSIVRGIYTDTWWTAFIIGMLVFPFRPPLQIVFVLVTIAWIWWFIARLKGFDHRQFLVQIMITVFIVFCLVVFYAWLTMNPPSGDGIIAIFVQKFKVLNDYGIVVCDRPHTYHSPPEGMGDYMFLILDRFYHMFVFHYSEYSFIHKVFCWLYFPIYYLIALFGAYQLITRRNRFSYKDYLLVGNMFLLVNVFSLFYAFQGLSYGWRYQLSNMPAIWLLAIFSITTCSGFSTKWR